MVTCHDMIPLVYPSYFSLRERIIYRLAHKMAMRAARLVISVSESTRLDLVRFCGADPGRIAVIHSGVSGRFFRRSGEEIAAVCRRYGLPESYVLYVGTNKPHKNLETLVEAWKILDEEKASPGTGLAIAGHWDARYPGPKARAARCGVERSVFFLDSVSDADLPALYSGARLFVFPSFYEGFGFPVLEAMACETPVASSKTSSLPEVAGDAALYFDPCNAGEMASAMGSLLLNGEMARALVEKGKLRASAFTWRATAAKTLALYRKALGGRS